MIQCPLHAEDVMIRLREMMRQPTEKKKQKGEASGKKKPRDLDQVTDKPTSDKKLVLEVRSDSKTIVDGLDGHARLKVAGKYCGGRPESYGWSREVDLRRCVT